MKTKPAHPTSTNPTLAELNQLVYKIFPPTWNKAGWWGYGKLYYSGDHLSGIRIIGHPNFIDPHWILDGMTPVGPACVLGILRREGADITKFELFFEQLAADCAEATARCTELRQSASAKLSEDEREACGL